MRSAFHILTVILMFGLSKVACAQTAHDFSFTAIDGKALPLDQYQGQVVMVVNTASACGFTPQYDELQALYAEYESQGFVMLAVPSNDFGNQEPLTADGIKDFCEVNFNTTFPLTEKTMVKGDDAHPFYQWAGQQAGVLGKPRWNFHKYLIGRDGSLLEWFSTATSPTSNKVKSALEKALNS